MATGVTYTISADADFGQTAGASQTRTFHFKKNHRNSTRRHPERHTKGNGGGRRQKKSEILGSPAEEVRQREGPTLGSLGQGGPGEFKPTTTTNTTKTTPTPPKWRVDAKPRTSVGSPLSGFRVLVLWGLGFLGAENLAKTLKH